MVIGIYRVLWFCGFCCGLVGCSLESDKGPPSERVIPAELDYESRASYRKLPLDGAHNFRDLGGYPAADGQTVKWGMLYRSDALDALTEEDLVYVSRLGIRTFVDFRSTPERIEEPDRLPRGALEKPLPIEISMGPITGGSMDEIKQQVMSGEIDLSDVLVDANRALVQDFAHVYREFLSVLLEGGEEAVLFHCTAGKDRAGFAAALILRILGVSQETVIEDYLKTNIYVADEVERTLLMIRFASFFQADLENIRPILGVEERYISAAFDAIDSEWGSFDRYVSKGLGIGPEDVLKLRSIYLEPKPT